MPARSTIQPHYEGGETLPDGPDLGESTALASANVWARLRATLNSHAKISTGPATMRISSQPPWWANVRLFTP